MADGISPIHVLDSRGLRNLQTIVEIGVDKNTTVVFPASLMSTIQELGSFLPREKAASDAFHGPVVEAALAGPNGDGTPRARRR